MRRPSYDEPVRPQPQARSSSSAPCSAWLLGIGAAFLRRSLAGAVDDPMQIEQLLGSRVVFASIPHSDAQDELNRRAPAAGRQRCWRWSGRPTARSKRCAVSAPRCSSRMPRFDNNVIMFAGPTSSLGKSFVSANFAAVLAAGGKRVLLVDADVRNGRLHQYFGTARANGLCEAISGAVPIGDVIRRDVIERLDFIPTGCMPADRPDLLMPTDVGALLGTLRGDYDLVLVDSPPILALADSLVLGSHAGAVFLVVRAGVSTEREITESIKRLNQAGVSPVGILCNDVTPRLSGYGYKYGDGEARRLEYAV